MQQLYEGWSYGNTTQPASEPASVNQPPVHELPKESENEEERNEGDSSTSEKENWEDDDDDDTKHDDSNQSGNTPSSDEHVRTLAPGTGTLQDAGATHHRTRLPTLAKLPLQRPLLKSREKLPAYQQRELIVNTIDKNQVVVISGETGCGKSTQVPQLILEHSIQKNMAGCSIICTQPRRIRSVSSGCSTICFVHFVRVTCNGGLCLLQGVNSHTIGCTLVKRRVLISWKRQTTSSATSIACRVSDELNDRVGGLCGYKVCKQPALCIRS